MTDPIQTILNNIEFRFIHEQDEGKFDPYEGNHAPTPWQAADIANTYIQDSESQIFKNTDILRIPRGITVATSYVINQLIKIMPDNEIFLNVGVWYGYSFLSALNDNPTKKCIGVDHFSEFKENSGRTEFHALYNNLRTKHSEFYEIDFHTYFRSHHKGPIGVYFYDGEHSHKSHLDALTLAEPFFVKNTYVIIDDIDRPEVYKAITDFLSQKNNRSMYEIVLDKKTLHGFHPTWHCGLMILRKVR